LLPLVLCVTAQAEDYEPITSQSLRRAHDELREEIEDEVHGVFGPGSMVWKIFGERTTALSAAPAGLMMIADPRVASIVEVNSEGFRSAPRERIGRTADYVNAMMFGELEEALSAARHVQRVHAGIQPILDDHGALASASDPSASYWVIASIWYSVAKTYERIIGPLSAAEKERFHEEGKRFAKLMGIPEKYCPATWNDFLAYVDSHVADLEPGPWAKGIAQRLITPEMVSSRLPQWLPRKEFFYRPAVRTIGSLLPAALAERYGIERGRASRSFLRLVVPFVPAFARHRGVYQEAVKRVDTYHCPETEAAMAFR
jgi:uncharacterized protein (DUF2236 family)